MGKVKNYLQEKAEEFIHEIEDKVSKGKMTKGCAYKLSVDRKDEIAFDLVGFDSDNIDTQIEKLSAIAKEKLKSPFLMDTMEEHSVDDILDRISRYQNRKQIIKKLG